MVQHGVDWVAQFPGSIPLLPPSNSSILLLPPPPLFHHPYVYESEGQSQYNDINPKGRNMCVYLYIFKCL